MLAVPIKNSMPALLEQKTLAVHIICKILVLIFSDMIRFKIGKHADIKHKSGYAMKHQRLGRDFHHNSIESRIYHFCKKLLHRAFLNAKKQCDKWGDFEMHVAPFDKDQPIYYEFTACPTAEFAKKHNLLEVMPALCNPDFAGMELIHARLIRKTTCSNGCKCDYTICGDKDPYCREHPEYRDEQGYRRNK